MPVLIILSPKTPKTTRSPILIAPHVTSSFNGRPTLCPLYPAYMESTRVQVFRVQGFRVFCVLDFRVLGLRVSMVVYGFEGIGFRGLGFYSFRLLDLGL